MSNVLFKTGTSTNFSTITPSYGTIYWLTDTNELFFGAKKITNQADLTAAITRLTTVEGDIDALELLTQKLDAADSVSGSIKQQIKAAIEALDSSATIASKNTTTNVVTIKAGITETDGSIGNSSASDIILASVAATGSAGDLTNTAIAGVNKDVSGTPTATVNVQDTLEALKALIDSADSAGIIYAVEGGDSGDVLKSYTLYQGGTPTVDGSGKTTAVTGGRTVTTINVPKDYLVKNAAVSTVTSADKASGGKFENDSDFAVGDKYIDFTVNTIGSDGTPTHLYINVNDLMEALSVETGASEVQLAISGTNQLSASVVDIAASKVTYIAADAGNSIARESVGAALQRLDGSDSTTGSVAKKIKDSINALDATVSISDNAGTNPLNIEITEANGVITSVTGSIDSNTFDNYGSAAAVLGSNSDTSTANTVYGAKAKTAALETLVGTIPKKGGTGEDQNDPVASTVIGYIDLKTGSGISALDSTAQIASKSGNSVTIKTGLVEVDGIISNDSGTDITLSDVASTGASVNVSIADSGNIFTATNVENALQEVKALADQNSLLLTWQEF